MSATIPELSVVLPVAAADPSAGGRIQALLTRLPATSDAFELLACEYGRTESEDSPLNALADRHPSLRVIPTTRDRAMRDGIAAARGTFVLGDIVDDDDLPFLTRALPLLRSGEAELVAGSSVLGRPLSAETLDTWTTRTTSALLALTAGFRGTDAGGPKLWRRDRLTEVAAACIAHGELFTAEFVIRAGRMSRKVVELPTPPRRRLPTPDRVPVVVRELSRVAWSLRVNGT